MDESVQKSSLRWLVPVAAGLAVVAVAVFVYPFLGGGLPSPAQLEATALDSSASHEERVDAALKLDRHGAKAQPQMRKLLGESKDSDVRAAALQGLINHGDWSDMPQMIKALDDPSPWVRTRAAQASWRLMGTKFGFDPHAGPAARAAAIKKIEEHYKWQDNYRKFHHDAPSH
jgi:hypothetical protein